MFCNRCGNELNKEDCFCVKCGAKINIYDEQSKNIYNAQPQYVKNDVLLYAQGSKTRANVGGYVLPAVLALFVFSALLYVLSVDTYVYNRDFSRDSYNTFLIIFFVFAVIFVIFVDVFSIIARKKILSSFISLSSCSISGFSYESVFNQGEYFEVNFDEIQSINLYSANIIIQTKKFKQYKCNCIENYMWVFQTITNAWEQWKYMIFAKEN